MRVRVRLRVDRAGAGTNRLTAGAARAAEASMCTRSELCAGLGQQRQARLCTGIEREGRAHRCSRRKAATSELPFPSASCSGVSPF